MSDSDLTPLFTYMDEKFSHLEDRLDSMDGKLITIQTSTDNLTKIVKDFQDEHIILRRKVEILETWAKQVSAKLGIPLPQGLLAD